MILKIPEFLLEINFRGEKLESSHFHNCSFDYCLVMQLRFTALLIHSNSNFRIICHDLGASEVRHKEGLLRRNLLGNRSEQWEAEKGEEGRKGRKGEEDQWLCHIDTRKEVNVFF